MKQLLVFFSFFLALETVNAQNLSNCQVVEWTLDDLNGSFQSGFDFGPMMQPNCGCSQSGLAASNCVLVRITLTKTVNGQMYKHNCSQLIYRGSWFSGRPSGNTTNYDFVDLFNPNNCGKYTEQGVYGYLQDSYTLPINNSSNGVVEFLICEGSDPGQMKGYFDENTWCTNTGVVYNPPSNPQDSDNDGVTDNLDCQPNNPNIYPGATEIPNNGIDEDCNGSDLVTNTPSTPTVGTPGRPTINLNAQLTSYLVDIEKEKSAYCYNNGKLSQPLNQNSTCGQGNGNVVILNVHSASLAPRPGRLAKKKVNVKSIEIEKFLKSQGGSYTGVITVCPNGKLVKGISCKACGGSSRNCIVIEMTMSK